MKLTYGKKIACPACALPFYDLQRTYLVCPNCGNSFDASEIKHKKASNIIMDEIDLDDKIVDIPGFEFNDEVDSTGLSEHVSDLSDETEAFEDIKIRKEDV